MRKIRATKTGKIVLVLVAILASTMLVSAALLTYFGTVQTTVDVRQSVTIDGNNWDTPVYEELQATGGCCVWSGWHRIENRGCQRVWLDFEHDGVPDLDGITIRIYYRLWCDSIDKEVIDDDTVLLHWRPLPSPFMLGCHDDIVVVFRYCFDPLIVPGVYGITSTLVPAEEPLAE